MVRLRVSAISYLNTAPLMWDFENPPQCDELKREFDVSYTLPSSCASALREGSVDIGIIPVAAYASIPGLIVIPNVAIAADGPVRSILLVSKKPLDEIKSVALDSSSRTSAALVRILFQFFYGRKPSYHEVAPNLEKMLAQHDSALLIGDSALQVNRAQYQTWDLSEEWRRLTGKPFVFAFWAIRERSVSSQRLQYVAHVFQQSRDSGLSQTPVLVQNWASKLGLPSESIRAYLTQNIHYHLETKFIEGMKLFFRYAAESGLLSHNPDLHFIE
jgi:chorismate dehydratase